MSVMNSTGERLRRATALWHAYLTTFGQRFELAQFLKDSAFERQVIDGALASGDQKLISLAQDWLRDTGQAVPAVPGSRAVNPQSAVSAASVETGKPARYLRGVR
jgi:hypothetical protein